MKRIEFLKTVIGLCMAFFCLTKTNKAQADTVSVGKTCLTDISFKSFVTRDVLIESDDGTLDLNTYREFVAFVGDAITKQQPIMRLAFQSNPIHVSEFTTSAWNRFERECLDYCQEYMKERGRSIAALPNKVKIKLS